MVSSNRRISALLDIPIVFALGAVVGAIAALLLGWDELDEEESL